MWKMLKIRKINEKKGAWVTNLFSTKPHSTINEEKQKLTDQKLLQFYDESLKQIKENITGLNIVGLEQSFIDVIQELNYRKF